MPRAYHIACYCVICIVIVTLIICVVFITSLAFYCSSFSQLLRVASFFAVQIFLCMVTLPCKAWTNRTHCFFGGYPRCVRECAEVLRNPLWICSNVALANKTSKRRNARLQQFSDHTMFLFRGCKYLPTCTCSFSLGLLALLA